MPPAATSPALCGPARRGRGRPLEPQLNSVGLNVSGLLTLTHAIGTELASRGSGGIINVSSTAAFQPMPYQASYAATKAFVLSFSEALAEEPRGTGVHVMVAHPGAISTGFFDGTSATIDPRVADEPARVAARTLDDYARRRAVSYPAKASAATAARRKIMPDSVPTNREAVMIVSPWLPVRPGERARSNGTRKSS
ncbi:hypothetical protein DL991_40040 [Amycolatopsis sp. WAC 01375]|nr:hypothetical protein DL991_40040 [Amycolatopsis sp. WAC 01375]